jgi:peptide-methionine (R)-S-oxide reductase
MSNLKNNFLRSVLLIAAITALYGCNNPNAAQQAKSDKPVNTSTDKEAITKTDDEWKKILTPEQYHVLREKGTDAPFTGQYYLNKEKGLYTCAACGNELFTSDMKFESDCGWPSFDKEVKGGKIKTVIDKSHGMVRTEILCGRCGSHLGHLFDDGPTLTGKRYCVNSTSLSFQGTKPK